MIFALFFLFPQVIELNENTDVEELAERLVASSVPQEEPEDEQMEEEEIVVDMATAVFSKHKGYYQLHFDPFSNLLTAVMFVFNPRDAGDTPMCVCVKGTACGSCKYACGDFSP